MQDCVEVGVKGAIVISAGFKETGADGALLENEIMDIAREANIRIVGPNCLGVMVRYTRVYAYLSSVFIVWHVNLMSFLE